MSRVVWMVAMFAMVIFVDPVRLRAAALTDSRSDPAILGEEDLPQTIEALSERVASSPDDARLLLMLTRAHLRNKDPEFAEFYFEMALGSSRRAEAPAALWRAIGDLWSISNAPGHAREAWSAARLAGDSSEELRRKIARAQREAAAETNQCYFQGDRFEIAFDCGIGEKDIERVESILEDAEKEDEKVFGVALKSHSPVVVDLGRRVLRALETPEWVAGFFDGRIHVPLFSGESIGSDTDGLFRHELAHAFLAQLTHGQAPGWLQEGLAQYVEGRRINPGACAELFPQAGVLASLDPDFRQRVDRERARRAYLLSLSFLEYLVERRGLGSVVCIVVNLGRGDDIDTAVSREMGSSMEDLEREWRDLIRRSARGTSRK